MNCLLRYSFLAIALASGRFASLAPPLRANAERSLTSGLAPAAEIAGLRRQIAAHDERYFRQGTPEISDFDYDQLRRRLVELETAFPAEAESVAPLPVLPDERSGVFRVVAHRERMASLQKCYTESELRAFDARLQKTLGRRDVAYVVEPKYDGIAVSVTYEEGRLVRALTRGNGTEGEDITGHVLQFGSVPRTLAPAQAGPRAAFPRVIEIRGELYVPFAAFARANAEREAAGEAPFSHPRSVAAGAVRQLDAEEMRRRGLKAVFFALGACEPESVRPSTQRELRAWFERHALPVVAKQWIARGPDELVRAVEDVRRTRGGFEYPTDGCVVKLDDRAGQRLAGEGEAAPRWAVACKFAPDRAETRLLAITLQVGRTGVLTPVAELAPVELGGSTITRATLHNRAEIARRDLRVGDHVWVEKAGDVIPAVAGVNLARRPAGALPYSFPEGCPACGSNLVQPSDTAAVRCPGAACPAQLRRRLEHFASKGCVDISGLGPATIDALVDGGLVKSIADLYQLHRDNLVGNGRIGSRTADRLLAAIAASRRAELWRFIHGLGMPGVGPAASRELARRLPGLEALLAPGVADDTAPGRAVAAHLADPRNRAVISGLIAAGIQPSNAREEATAMPLKGKTFVLTGTLPTLNRAEATALIQSAGGKTTSSVTRATHYVVAGAGAGAKLEQARRLGIPVVEEAQLRKMAAPVEPGVDPSDVGPRP